MKAAIDVSSRDEGDAIKRAMHDPATRALVVVLGTLSALPSAESRRRVLDWILDATEDGSIAVRLARSDNGNSSGE